MSDDVDASPLHRLVSPQSGIFLVSRTSAWSAGAKPCEEAYRVEVMAVDRRVKSFDPTKSSDWFQRGTNHRIEDGEHCRDLGWETAWAVNVPDIVAFVEKYGECVVSKYKHGFAKIEIYDDYRE